MKESSFLKASCLVGLVLLGGGVYLNSRLNRPDIVKKKMENVCSGLRIIKGSVLEEHFYPGGETMAYIKGMPIHAYHRYEAIVQLQDGHKETILVHGDAALKAHLKYPQGKIIEIIENTKTQFLPHYFFTDELKSECLEYAYKNYKE